MTLFPIFLQDEQQDSMQQASTSNSDSSSDGSSGSAKGGGGRSTGIDLGPIALSFADDQEHRLSE